MSANEEKQLFAECFYDMRMHLPLNTLLGFGCLLLFAASKEDSCLMLGYSWTHKTSWADVLGCPAEAVEPLLLLACASIFIIIIVSLYYLFYVTALLVFPIGMLKNQHI